MSYNSFISNPASGADSTQAQEQVKGFSSSSPNLNDVEVYDLDDYKADFSTGNPAVYVGTYAKYNCVYGCEKALFGCWLDLTKFADYDEFIAVCRYLHRDEKSPELMAQDYESFPREFYTEGFMSEREFDLIKAYSELSDDDKEAFEAYISYRGFSSSDDERIFDDFREAYMGEWKSEEDFAEHIAEECDMLHDVPENLRYYFDWSKYARDLFMCDFHFDSGHVFRCY